MYTIKYYPDEDRAPILELLVKLNESGQHQQLKAILYYIDKLRDLGFEMNTQYKPESYKKIDNDLWELRPNKYRVLFTFDSESQAFHILHGFKKQKGKTPMKEIKRARKAIQNILVSTHDD